jgi:glycosyltransferase involved in cell wall biosynthesis
VLVSERCRKQSEVRLFFGIQVMKHTVAIPSYRRPDLLRRSLEGLLMQERPVDEVIVAARREDEDTQRVAQEFQTNLPIHLQLVEGPGMITPVNRALDTATGDIVSIIDDDAVPHPDWARRIIEVFETEPDLAGLGGKDHIFADGYWWNGQAKVVGIVGWYGRLVGNHHLGFGPRRNVDILKGVNMSFRMSALGATRMDNRLRGRGAQVGCDLKLCLDLRAQGKRLAYDPAIVVDHYPGPRAADDRRVDLQSADYEGQAFNVTFALLKYLSPPGRILHLLYAFGIGMRHPHCGALKTLLYWFRLGYVPWKRGLASARGTYAAWKAHGAHSPLPL